LFGTAVNAERKWPDQYGVLGDYVPNGFLKQVAFPFTWRSSLSEIPPPPPAQKNAK
jgi:hypothetical protein